MSIRVALTHATRYRYDRAVSLAPHVVRLRPAPHCRTPIPSYSLRIKPEEHFLNWQQDPFGNYQARLAFPRAGARADRRGRSGRRHDDDQPVRLLHRGLRREVPVRVRRRCSAGELAPYREPVGRAARRRAGRGAARERRAARTPHRRRPGRPQPRAVRARIRYVIRMEPGVFTPEETLTRGHGSCRDFAWLLVALLRHLGFAARFVSGYSIQLKPDVAAARRARRASSEDFTDLHAWAEVYLPGAGWVGLDSDLRPAGRRGPHPARLHRAARDRRADHRLVLVGRRGDGRSASARSSRSRCACTRIHETPRVTQAVHRGAVGGDRRAGRRRSIAISNGRRRAADDGRRADVRLDRRLDGAEWNTAALGPGKRAAGRPAAAPAARRASRRAACCTTARASGTRASRCRAGRSPATGARDGEPIWRDPACIAKDAPATRRRRRRRRRLHHARSRERLGVDARLRAARATRTSGTTCGASAGCRPTSTSLENKLEDRDGARAAGARVRAGPGRGRRLRPAAARAHRDGRRAVALGERRRGRCAASELFLIPGDSPMGYRLPLDSLPWASRRTRAAGSTSAIRSLARPPLTRVARRRRVAGRSARGTPARRRRSERARTRRARPIAGVVRTALCVEPRDGRAARLHAAARLRSRTISTWSPPSRTRRASSSSRSGSRATRRRPITA